jgi:hypothetical protein
VGVIGWKWPQPASAISMERTKIEETDRRK